MGIVTSGIYKWRKLVWILAVHGSTTFYSQQQNLTFVHFLSPPAVLWSDCLLIVRTQTVNYQARVTTQSTAYEHTVRTIMMTKSLNYDYQWCSIKTFLWKKMWHWIVYSTLAAKKVFVFFERYIFTHIKVFSQMPGKVSC